MAINTSTGVGQFTQWQNQPILFLTNNGSATAERARITSTGLSVTGSVSATTGWSGTTSSAGNLGGIVQQFFCLWHQDQA